MVQRWIYVSIMRCNDTNKIFFKIIVGKNMNIEPCPKCKKASGWTWTWGKNDGKSTGYATCKGCGAKF